MRLPLVFKSNLEGWAIYTQVILGHSYWPVVPWSYTDYKHEGKFSRICEQEQESPAGGRWY